MVQFLASRSFCCDLFSELQFCRIEFRTKRTRVRIRLWEPPPPLSRFSSGLIFSRGPKEWCCLILEIKILPLVLLKVGCWFFFKDNRLWCLFWKMFDESEQSERINFFLIVFFHLFNNEKSYQLGFFCFSIFLLLNSPILMLVFFLMTVN